MEQTTRLNVPLSSGAVRAAGADGGNPAGVCVSAERRLLNDDVLSQLRCDGDISALVAALRAHDRAMAAWASGLGDAQMHFACQQDIFYPLEAEGVEPFATVLGPEEFAHAVYELPRTPRLAAMRRMVRENARIYALACTGCLRVPDNPGEFHGLWNRAMEGEPRWNESQPLGAFRSKPARILKGKSLKTVLQICIDPADYESELSRLLAFLRDETLAPEVRAACGYALFEWIHPFSDGNGHVGRMLCLALLRDAYSVPSMIRFSQALSWGKARTSRLFAPLRSGEGTLVDFCGGTLAQLHREQIYPFA